MDIPSNRHCDHSEFSTYDPGISWLPVGEVIFINQVEYTFKGKTIVSLTNGPNLCPFVLSCEVEGKTHYSYLYIDERALMKLISMAPSEKEPVQPQCGRNGGANKIVGTRVADVLDDRPVLPEYVVDSNFQEIEKLATGKTYRLAMFKYTSERMTEVERDKNIEGKYERYEEIDGEPYVVFLVNDGPSIKRFSFCMEQVEMKILKDDINLTKGFKADESAVIVTDLSEEELET